MKSYHIQTGEGIAGLKMREHEDPQPGPRQVLVRVRASSLSYRELLILRGLYPLPVRPDVVPLSDGAGEIVAVGEGVSSLKPGDRVAATVFPSWIDGPFGLEYAQQRGGSLDGMLSELVVLDEEGVVSIPEHLSFEEAATLPCVAVTAWNALTGGRGLLAGETVLTLGSGGVSLFALQFAKLLGAQVIATTSSDEKAQRLKALGADEVINYRQRPVWHEAVRELTNGQGVDHVVEVTSPGTLEQSIKSTAVSGEVGLVGWFPSAVSTIDITVIAGGLLTVRGIAIGSRAQFRAMNRAIAHNQLKPVIDRIFPFEDAPAAYRYYEENQPFGKVIIRHS